MALFFSNSCFQALCCNSLLCPLILSQAEPLAFWSPLMIITSLILAASTLFQALKSPAEAKQSFSLTPNSRLLPAGPSAHARAGDLPWGGGILCFYHPLPHLACSSGLPFWVGDLVTPLEEGYILQRPCCPVVTPNDEREAAPMSSLHLCHCRPLQPAPRFPLWFSQEAGVSLPVVECGGRGGREQGQGRSQSSCPVGTPCQPTGFCSSASIRLGSGLTLPLEGLQPPSSCPAPRASHKGWQSISLPSFMGRGGEEKHPSLSH